LSKKIVLFIFYFAQMCSNDNLKLMIDTLKEQNAKEHKEVFEWIKDIKEDLKDFIEKADQKYSTKQENISMYKLQEQKNKVIEKKVDKHQSIIEKLSRLIITGVLVTAWSWLILIIKTFF